MVRLVRSLLLVSALLAITAAAQRSYTAKFADCGEANLPLIVNLVLSTIMSGFYHKTENPFVGSLAEIANPLSGPVTITAPYNRKTGRHVLGKVGVELVAQGMRLQMKLLCWSMVQLQEFHL